MTGQRRLFQEANRVGAFMKRLARQVQTIAPLSASEAGHPLTTQEVRLANLVAGTDPFDSIQLTLQRAESKVVQQGQPDARPMRRRSMEEPASSRQAATAASPKGLAVDRGRFAAAKREADIVPALPAGVRKITLARIESPRSESQSASTPLAAGRIGRTLIEPPKLQADLPEQDQVAAAVAEPALNASRALDILSRRFEQQGMLDAFRSPIIIETSPRPLPSVFSSTTSSANSQIADVVQPQPSSLQPSGDVPNPAVNIPSNATRKMHAPLDAGAAQPQRVISTTADTEPQTVEMAGHISSTAPERKPTHISIEALGGAKGLRRLAALATERLEDSNPPEPVSLPASAPGLPLPEELDQILRREALRHGIDLGFVR